MTRFKSLGKKTLSIFLTLLMCLSIIPLLGETTPEAEAATAGTYSVRVRIRTTNSVDVGDNKNLTITLNHKGNNGAGSALTAKTASVSYTWAENDDADNTYTFTGCGYPTSVSVACTYAWTLAITRKWEFTMYVSVLDNDTNTYTQVLEQSFSKSGDGAGQTEVTFNSNTIGSTPAATRIEWTNTAKSITVPKTGTATAATSSATVYDQYGVEWYQEPNYAYTTTDTVVTSTTSVAGVTLSGQGDTCTVSVTNAAKTWVNNGGGNSGDIYVSAYLSNAKTTTTTKFTINQVQYTVKFYNGGTLLNTATANQLFYYNKQPYYNGTPTKAADAQYSYVFDGWTTSSDGSGTVYTALNLPVATADTTYYAHYDEIINQYTVTFKNYDGTVLQSGKLYYGDTPAYTGTTPVKPNTPEYSYTFAGWNPSVNTVTGEAIYTAYFTETKNKYNVEFQNEDGTTLQSSAVEYGVIPSYTGETPAKASTDEYDYVFSGWTPEIQAVTTQAVYTAVFDSVKRKYDVVFKNDDGTVLQNTKWEYGTMPAYSETPVKAATAEYTYTFKGWSPAVVPVTGAAEYTAVYDAVKNEYTVYYKNYDGSEISEEKVAYGEAAQMADSLAPEKPASGGKTYVFAGWSAELDYITKNTYAVAQYAVEGVENYWVTFVDTDGTVLYKTIVEEGGTAVYGGEETAKDGYEFVGWDKSLENITEDTTVTALYSKNGEQYVVTYVDWDDTFIKSMIVNHGEDAVAPEDPARESDENTVYTFAGWDNDGKAVTSNLVIKATYDIHTHGYETFVENVTPATCIANRTDRFSCSCGLTKDIEIEDSKDADNHTGTLTLTGAKEVKCTENGYTGDMVCDACGEVATAGEVIEAPGHTKGEATVENAESGSCIVPGTYEEVYYCTVCDTEISREKKTGALLPHTPADAVRENVNDSTCYSEGSYEEVVYCSVEGCTEEISRTEKTIEKKEHTPSEAVRENVNDSTCYSEGSYDEVVYCSVEECKAQISREEKTIEKTEHTPAEAVRENVNDSTCYSEGSYEEVVYCSVEECKAQISREEKTIEKTEHTPAEAVRENVNDSTCNSEGSYDEVVYCSVEECKAQISRTEKTIEKKEHTPDEAVRENEIPATCAVNGKYDEVVYCSVCDEELSRKEQIILATGEHVYATEKEKAEATCTEDGYIIMACGCGDETTTVLPKTGHTEETISAVDATCTETGLTEGVKCSVCGETLTEQKETPALGHEMGEWTVTAPATCSAKGEERADCARCDHFVTRELDRAAHTEEIIPAADATCTETGLTEGVKCSVCGETLTAQTVIPANGHVWGEWVTVKEPTETENGLSRRDCDKCDAYEERTLYFADSGIVINADDTYFTGRTLPITATYDPSGMLVEAPVWTSSDEGIVFISDGRLIAIGEGEVTLTVTDGEFTATTTINVVAGGDARRVQFVNMDKMHFIIEDYYRIFDTAGFYWAEGEAIRFKVYAYSNFDFETYIVYVDGKEIEADENGYYTIPADTEWGIVTVQGAGIVEDSDGNTSKVSFWEMLLAFFRKIIAFFKGLAG